MTICRTCHLAIAPGPRLCVHCIRLERANQKLRQAEPGAAQRKAQYEIADIERERADAWGLVDATEGRR